MPNHATETAKIPSVNADHVQTIRGPEATQIGPRAYQLHPGGLYAYQLRGVGGGRVLVHADGTGFWH